ncbi:hypothetical protein V1291_001063 [Nitrobacteraceae bacterium AZCC 1564]
MPCVTIAIICWEENATDQYFLLFVRGLEQGDFGL